MEQNVYENLIAIIII